MSPLTKNNLPALVSAALKRAGIEEQLHSAIALDLLRHRAVELPSPIPSRPDEFMELIVIGGRSKQATRTAGAHLNVFAFASVVLAATATQALPIGAPTILLALLGACTVSLSPEQAAFVLANKALVESHVTPTAKAIASAMSTQLGGSPITPQMALQVAEQLQRLGMPLSVGGPPSYVLRHSEWVITVPGA